MSRTEGSTIAEGDGTGEDVESFRQRARAWLAEHMPRLPEGQTNRASDR